MADFKGRQGFSLASIPAFKPFINGSRTISYLGSMGPALPSLESALAGVLGARVRITTVLSQTLEGSLFTIDPITALVVIDTAAPFSQPLAVNTHEAGTGDQLCDFHFIPINRITSFNIIALAPGAQPAGLGPPRPGILYPILNFGNGEPMIGPVDVKAIRDRERQAVAKELAKEARQGKGVGMEGQEIFDALARTLPTRWQGTSIIVLDSVVITPPFGVENCRALNPKDGNSLARVKKVLEFELKKIANRIIKVPYGIRAINNNNHHYSAGSAVPPYDAQNSISHGRQNGVNGQGLSQSGGMLKGG